MPKLNKDFQVWTSLGVAQGMPPSQGNETEMAGSIGEINSRPWRPETSAEERNGHGEWVGQQPNVERLKGMEGLDQ